MRRTFVALALTCASLSLVAARCSSDDDTKLKIEKNGAASPPPDESSGTAHREPAPDDVRENAKGPAEKEPDDDLFRDPLDGPNPGGGEGSEPRVDDETILEDSSTFDPDSPPGEVSPDGPLDPSLHEGTPPELPADPVHDGTSDLDQPDAAGAPDLTQ